MIHQPVTAETVYAARGLGCWWRAGRTTSPSGCTSRGVSALAEAFASVSHPMSSDLLAEAGQTPYRLSRLIRSAREIRFAGDAIKHALLCRGRLHAAVDTVMFPWDIAAIVPCVEEAGGVVTGLSGDRDRVVHGGTLAEHLPPVAPPGDPRRAGAGRGRGPLIAGPPPLRGAGRRTSPNPGPAAVSPRLPGAAVTNSPASCDTIDAPPRRSRRRAIPTRSSPR